MFNLRQDPFGKHDQWKSRETAMKPGVAWGGQVQDAIAAHLKTFAVFPPPGGRKLKTRSEVILKKCGYADHYQANN